MDILKDIFRQFGVDWTKFLTQLVLFIIVYVILRKYAFGPILAMLEERRHRIEEGQLNAEKIKKQLAEAESRYQEMLDKANADAQKLIEEARASSNALAERRQQQAIAEAEQVIAKAREATQLDHEKMLSELKREVGRLVVATTAKVTGKILSPEDQRRLNEEAAAEARA